MFRFETAGESHGECLVATLTGLPAGIPISLDASQPRTVAPPAGLRPRRAHEDRDRPAEIVAGVRHSHTIGSPVAILIRNNDWKNWTEALPVEDIDGGEDKKKPVTRPRPGHADLAGAIKYNFHDARYILERASARETTARVAVGAHRQSAARRVRHRGAEPRDRGGSGAAGARRPPGTNWWRSAGATKSCWAAWIRKPKRA